MPYVQVRTSCPLAPEKMEILRASVADRIGLLPGKSVESLMIEIIPDCRLFLGSSDLEGCAFVEVLVNNELEEKDLKAYSKHLCEAVETVTGIPAVRVYVLHQSVRNWHSGRQFC